MSKKPYFSVRGFDKYQHYHNRRPPWIKLYHSIFTDFDFTEFADAARYHLIAIWLLASQLDNKIPFDPAYVKHHTQSTGEIDLQAFVNAGFIKVYNMPASAALSECLHGARPEVETETETEVETTLSDTSDALAPENPITDEELLADLYPDDLEEFDRSRLALAKSPTPPTVPADNHKPDLFNQFWATWPRKIHPENARTAWDKALKGNKRKKREPADPVVIIAAVEAQKKWAFKPLANEQWTPHASKWLNASGWMNEMTEPEAQPPPPDGTEGYTNAKDVDF